MANILLLDNIDSFTYNLVEQLRNQKNNVLIYRNTVDIHIILKSLKKLKLNNFLKFSCIFLKYLHNPGGREAMFKQNKS